MSDTRSDHPVEAPWPNSYEAPTLEPLGSVWERTGSITLGPNADATFPLLTA
jgi:hypothetical protein